MLRIYLLGTKRLIGTLILNTNMEEIKKLLKHIIKILPMGEDIIKLEIGEWIVMFVKKNK